jgi:hypothetical protein
MNSDCVPNNTTTIDKLSSFSDKKGNGKTVNQPDDSRTMSQRCYVLNCHLQAGKQGGRRVRQINEGVRSVLTLPFFLCPILVRSIEVCRDSATVRVLTEIGGTVLFVSVLLCLTVGVCRCIATSSALLASPRPCWVDGCSSFAV